MSYQAPKLKINVALAEQVDQSISHNVRPPNPPQANSKHVNEYDPITILYEHLDNLKKCCNDNIDIINNLYIRINLENDLKKRFFYAKADIRDFYKRDGYSKEMVELKINEEVTSEGQWIEANAKTRKMIDDLNMTDPLISNPQSTYVTRTQSIQKDHERALDTLMEVRDFLASKNSKLERDILTSNLIHPLAFLDKYDNIYQLEHNNDNYLEKILLLQCLLENIEGKVNKIKSNLNIAIALYKDSGFKKDDDNVKDEIMYA